MRRLQVRGWGQGWAWVRLGPGCRCGGHARAGLGTPRQAPLAGASLPPLHSRGRSAVRCSLVQVGCERQLRGRLRRRVPHDGAASLCSALPCCPGGVRAPEACGSQGCLSLCCLLFLSSPQVECEHQLEMERDRVGELARLRQAAEERLAGSEAKVLALEQAFAAYREQVRGVCACVRRSEGRTGPEGATGVPGEGVCCRLQRAGVLRGGQNRGRKGGCAAATAEVRGVTGAATPAAGLETQSRSRTACLGGVPVRRGFPCWGRRLGRFRALGRCGAVRARPAK